ncbi:hypothetical protein BDV93DRAFT_512337 [Ceratobasidium sp. AG-I]|nr:hypothetical protein BDV93DRAFT_512337 [Ceratobasidium sp. AG-I]
MRGNTRRIPRFRVRKREPERVASKSAGIPRARAEFRKNFRVTCLPGCIRNASTSWILSAWRWFQDHPDTVLNAWRLASFGGLDLSYSSLTSRQARATVYERFADDIPFAISIATSSSDVSDPKFEENADGPDYDDDSAIDPSVLCNIRSTLSSLPPKISVDDAGDFDYIDSEDLTDDDAEGESDDDCFEFDPSAS